MSHFFSRGRLQRHIFVENDKYQLIAVCMCTGVQCFPGLMFSSLYVPRSYVPRHLCCPAPIFPVSHFPWSYVPQYLYLTVLYSRCLCSPLPMFPRHIISPNGIYFRYFVFSLICTFVVSNFLLFCTFVV